MMCHSMYNKPPSWQQHAPVYPVALEHNVQPSLAQAELEAALAATTYATDTR